MIKEIKKIDLQGNEYYQEVVICNRCKRILDPEEFLYTIRWTGWHPVRMKPNTAYGFGGDSNKDRHICSKCFDDVEAYLDGQDLNKLKNFAELKTSDYLSTLPESELYRMLNSIACSTELAKLIHEELKSRGRQ